MYLECNVAFLSCFVLNEETISNSLKQIPKSSMYETGIELELNCTSQNQDISDSNTLLPPKLQNYKKVNY